MSENRILPADELPELEDLNDALVRDGKWPFVLPDTLLGGAVQVILPADLRNRAGTFMLEQGCAMGDKIDAGIAQDWMEKFSQRVLEEERRRWISWGVVEIAVRNPQIAEYCEHWEARTEKAEAELRLIDAVLERRPALADLNDRYLKVERACSIAGRAESAESRLAELSAIVEPLRELWDKRTNVTDFYDHEAANEEYEEAALTSVSRLLALVPPVEKEK